MHKNILLIFPPREKATNKYYFRVNHEISALEDDFNVHIIDTPSRKEKINVFLRALTILTHIKIIYAEVKKNDFVIIYFSPIWIITIPIIKLFNKKLILDHYTTSIYNFEYKPKYVSFVFKKIDKLLYHHIDLIFTHSNSMKNLIVDFYGIDPSNVSVLYSIVDLKSFSIHQNKAPLMLPSENIIIYHGLFHSFHGVDTIIKASTELVNDDVFFLIIGRKLKHHYSNIKSVPAVSYSLLPMYLSLGKVWVGSVGLGAQGYRALSSNMIAAMGAGLPVIVGDWPENKLVIQNNINGFIIKRGGYKNLVKKIRSVLRRTDLKVIGQQSRKTVEQRFSLPIFKKEMLRALKNI